MYKIFLTSLSWLEMKFLPGMSNLLSLSDYFSRKYNDTQKFSQKLPTKCDIKKCQDLNQKLRKNMQYSASNTMYLIDSLLEESETTLYGIQDNTYRIKDNKIAYVSKSSNCEKITEKEDSISAKTNSEPIKKEPLIMDAYEVKLVKTRSMQKLESEDGHPTKHKDTTEDTKILDNDGIKIGKSVGMEDTLNNIKSKGNDRSISSELDKANVKKSQLKIRKKNNDKMHRMPGKSVRRTHNFDNKSEQA